MTKESVVWLPSQEVKNIILNTSESSGNAVKYWLKLSDCVEATLICQTTWKECPQDAEQSELQKTQIKPSLKEIYVTYMKLIGFSPLSLCITCLYGFAPIFVVFLASHPLFS